MKNKLFSIIAGGLLIATSCGDDDGENEAGNQECGIETAEATILYMGASSDSTYATTTIQYDENGNITSFLDSYSGEGCYLNNDETICDGFEGSREYRFTYNGNEIAEVIFYEDGELDQNQSFDVTYDNGLIKTFRTEYEDGEYTDIDMWEFIYENGLLTKVEKYNEVSTGATDELELQYTSQYTYTGNNITKSEIIGADGVTDYEYRYEYDSNPNFTKGHVVYYFSLYFEDIIEDIGLVFNENNPTSIVYTELRDNDVMNTTIDYTYNESGFPTDISYLETTEAFQLDMDISMNVECN